MNIIFELWKFILLHCKNLKKDDNLPRFIYEKEISLVVRPSRKKHDWVLLFSWKNIKNWSKAAKYIAFLASLLYFYQMDKKNYVFMKFHFKLKCKEFPYRLSMCTVLKKFNLTLLKVVKYIESFLPWATFDLWNSTKVSIVFFS